VATSGVGGEQCAGMLAWHGGSSITACGGSGAIINGGISAVAK